MADLGNLYFDILFRDKTEEQRKKLKEQITKDLQAKLELSFDKQSLVSGVRGLLQAEKFKINVVVDKAEATQAVRQALQQAGTWNGRYTADDLRAARAQAANLRAQAQAAASNELARQRAARAAKAELDLANAQERAAQAAARQARAALGLNRATGEQSRLAGELKNQLLGLYSVYAAQSFLRSLIEIGGQFETQRLALGSILRDASHAAETFSKIKSLAVVSPFGVKELTDYSKQLAAYSTPYNELYDTTKRLADISAGLGVDMGRIILAFGQVRAAKFLKGTELRQFTEAGVPLVQALADKFSLLERRVVSAGEVLDMISKKKVTFDDMKDVLWAMTDDGGMFHDMQETLSESLAGKWSNLKDAYDIMLSDMAESTNGILKTGISGLTALMNNWRELVPFVEAATVAYGAHRAATFLLNRTMGESYAAARRSILASKQREAAALRLEAKVRALDAAEQERIATAGQMTNADYRQLVSTGALTKGKATLLIATRRVTGEQAAYLAGLLKITPQELAAIRSTSRFGLAVTTLGNAARSTGAALKAMVWNPYTAIFAAVTAIMELYAKWKGDNEAMERSIGEVSQKAQEGFKALQAQAVKFGNVDLGTVNGDELIQGIREIQQTLKDYAPDSSNILQEADRIEDLTKRFAYLREQLNATRDAYELLNEAKEAGVNADRATGNWLTDDYLTENIADYIGALGKASKLLAGVGKYRIEIGNALQGAAAKNPSFAEAVKGKGSLEEQIKVLVEYREAWADAVAGLSGQSVEVRKAFADYAFAAAHASSVLDSDVLPDLKKAAATLRDALTAKGYDFSKLTDAQVKNIRLLVDAVLSQVEGITPEIQRMLATQWLTVEYGIKPVVAYYDEKPILTALAQKIKDFEAGYKGAPQTSAGRYSLFTEKELANLGTDAQVVAALDAKVKESAEALKAAERIKDNTKKIREAKGKYDYAKAVRDAFLNPSGKDDSGKNLSKEDTELKLLKERFRQVKEFVALYEKLSAVYGKAESLERARRSGLFAAGLFGTSTPASLDKDVAEEMRKIIKQAGTRTIDRRTLSDDACGYAVELEVKTDKKSLERAMSEVEKSLADFSKRWNAFQDLRDGTGNAPLAFSVAFGSVPGSEMEGYAEMLKKAFDKAMRDQGFSYTFDSIAKEGMEGLPDSVYKVFQSTKEKIDAFDREESERLAGVLKEYQSNRDKMVAVETEAAKKIAAIRKALAEGKITPAKAASLEESVNAEAAYKKFTMGADYLKFFSSVYSLTLKEAEKIGRAIRENLDRRMQAGTLSAEEYYKEVERIGQQLEKMRAKNGDVANFFQGGLQGLWEGKKERGESEYRQGTIELQKAVEAWEDAMAAGNSAAVKVAQADMASAKDMQAGGQSMADGASQALSTMNLVDKIVHGINDMVQGMSESVSLMAEMADAYGTDTGAGSGWGNAKNFFSTFAEASNYATKAWDSLKSGNAGGVLSGVVGSITSWFTGFAKYHDAKLERQIQESQQRAEKLQAIYDRIEASLERTLGSGASAKSEDAERDMRELEAVRAEISRMQGTKSFGRLFALQSLARQEATLQNRVQAYKDGGAYGYQRALLQEQITELEKQRQAELDKKNTDDSAVVDYENQIAELRQQVKDFAEETADTLYGINLKQWASDLGDALYEAWQKGEDGAEAFREKVADIMGDVTNQVLKVGLLEPAMEGLQEMLFGTDGTSGLFGNDFKLDDSELDEIADYLMGISSKTDDYYDAMDRLNDYMEKKYGVSMKEEEDSSGSLTKNIEGVTETTADLLASYLNAIRADVSVNREYLRRCMEDLLPGANGVAEAQLGVLRNIQQNTDAISRSTAENARLAAEIRDLIDGARRDKNKGFYVR